MNTPEIALEALCSLKENMWKGILLLQALLCVLPAFLTLIRMNGAPSRIATYKVYSATCREASTFPFCDFSCRERLDWTAVCNPHLTTIFGGISVWFEAIVSGLQRSAEDNRWKLMTWHVPSLEPWNILVWYPWKRKKQGLGALA